MHEEDRNVLKLAHEFGHHSTGKEKVELSARLHPVLFVKNPFDSIYIEPEKRQQQPSTRRGIQWEKSISMEKPFQNVDIFH